VVPSQSFAKIVEPALFTKSRIFRATLSVIRHSSFGPGCSRGFLLQPFLPPQFSLLRSLAFRIIDDFPECLDNPLQPR